MNKKLLKIFSLAFSLVIMISCCVSANADCVRLYDEAGLLTSEEASALAGRLDEFSADLGFDIVVAVFNDMADYGYQDIMEFADDYYDNNGFGADGVALVMSMADRDYWITTAGYGITAITDAGIDMIEENAVPYLSSGEYYNAFSVFSSCVSGLVDQARSGNIYDNYSGGSEISTAPLTRAEKIANFEWGKSIIISIIIGVVVALIAVSAMKNKLKSVRQKSSASDYVVPGSLNLLGSNDIFLYSSVSAVPKPKDPPKTSSGGGSTVHTSSGGVSHGGGGGKF